MGPQKLILIIIFILALSLRLLLAISCKEIPTYDAQSYDETGLSIAEGRGYSLSQKLTTFKAPFYSYFLGGIYYIFGHNYTVVRVIQAILGAFVCIIIYFIAKETFGSIVALLSAFLVSIYPVFISASSHLLSETLFVFLVSLCILYFFVLKRKPVLSNEIILGGILGLLVLTRSVGILLLFVLISFIWGKENFKSFNIKQRFKIFLTILFVSCLTIAPWTIRNYLLFKEFIPISTEGGRAFYASWCPPQGKLFGFNPTDSVTEKAQQISSEAERDKFLYRKTFNFIFSNSRRLPRLELLKILFFWSPFDWEILGGDGIYNAVYGFIFPFFLIGMFLLVKKKRRNSYPLLFIILYFQLFTLVFYGSPRLRIPIEPFLIILASFGFNEFYMRFNRKILPLSISMVYLGLNVFFYIYSGTIKQIAKNFLEIVGIW